LQHVESMKLKTIVGPVANLTNVAWKVSSRFENRH